MKNTISILCLWMLSCFLGVAHGAEADPRLAALIEGAKKEGKMVFYTSVETEFARILTTAFEAKYPFIKTDIFRSSHERIFSRLNVERKTGNFAVDVLSVGEFETYHMKLPVALIDCPWNRSEETLAGIDRYRDWEAIHAGTRSLKTMRRR